MAGDPSDVGSAPENVFFLEIEDPIHGGKNFGEIAPGGVDDALGLTRRARGIEHI